jgi:UDP-hydrolysing UDP-N-acetyl-D-glucosamine 2-epimerase
VLAEYGNTIREVEKDRFTIIATPSILVKGDTTSSMSQAVGLAVLYFSDILSLTRPDAILLLGDRGEMVAAAIAAHFQNIGIIHIHGGECSGSADDAIRHAISKLAHLHFVSSEKSKKNLIAMGEEEWRIIPVGSLRKQLILQVSRLEPFTKDQWVKKYHLDTPHKNVLLAMHPDSKELLPYDLQITAVLDAIKTLSHRRLFVIGPNSDSGGGLFREKLLRFVREHQHSYYYSSIPDDEYLFLLSQMDVFIGNSSSGILEAPFFHVPFISIGNRQNKREKAENVITVPYDSILIRESIDRQLEKAEKVKVTNPFDLHEFPEKEFVKNLCRLLEHPQCYAK